MPLMSVIVPTKNRNFGEKRMDFRRSQNDDNPMKDTPGDWGQSPREKRKNPPSIVEDSSARGTEKFAPLCMAESLHAILSNL